MPARLRLILILAGIAAFGARPCPAADAVSRAVTIFYYRSTPPSPVTEALSRPMTVFLNPVPPAGPVTEAVSRPVTVFNRGETLPGPVTEALSRPMTVFLNPVPPAGPVTEAVSRPVTVFNRGETLPGPVTEALSRPVTVFLNPVPPAGPISEAVSRPLTIFRYAVSPPVLVVEVISRALTVRNDAQTGVPDRAGPDHRLSMQHGRPNPFHPSTVLRFSLPYACKVELAIYDVRGVRVVTLIDGELPAGEQKAVWAGVDGLGAPVAAGLYFARLTTPAGVRSVKLALSR